MKIVVALIVSLAIFTLVSSSLDSGLNGIEDSWAEDFLESQTSALNTFERFLDFWQRPYRSDPAEKAKRFEVFRKTLTVIDERNAHEERHNPHPNRAQHGITKFADWTEAEFQAMLGGGSKKNRAVQKPEEVQPSAPKSIELPAMEGGADSTADSSCTDTAGWITEDGYDCAGFDAEKCDLYGEADVDENGVTANEACCVCDGGVRGADSSCADKKNDCPQWKSQGDCSSVSRYATFMAENCAYTCGKCDSVVIPDSSQAPCTKIHPTGLRDSGIRDQGQCGDCWAFSTTETLRSTYIREHGEDPGELSTQYLVDCSPRAAAVCPSSKVPSVGGCCGGSPENAYEFIHSSGGIPTAAEYGDLYLNRTDTGLAEFSETGTSPIISSWKGITFSGVNPDTKFPCKSNVPKKVTVTNLQGLSSESAMAEHVCSTSSISILLATAGWNTYKSGVMSASTCGTSVKSVDHAVMIVGMNASANAWIVQNSWGSDFGVTAEGSEVPSSETGIVIEADGASQAMFGGGYIYIAYGDNACDITANPIFVSGTRLV